MKKPRERFRHLKVPRPANDAQRESRADEARQLIAEWVENVVEVPAYHPRTEAVRPSRVRRVLLRWVVPMVGGIAVLFGVVYGAVSLYDRNQRIQAQRERASERARVLANLRTELGSNVKQLRDQVVLLDALEESARSWQHLPPPKMDVAYVSSMWRAFALEMARSEEAAFFGRLERFYDSLPSLERRFRDLERDATNWHTWKRGITPQSLARSRNQAFVSQVRRINNEFANKVARLRDAVVAQRDLGEVLLKEFPSVPDERKTE